MAGVPLLLVAIDAVPSPANFGWSALTAPDDGTVALAVIGVVAWIAWAVFTISILLDIAARLRGHTTPRVPGFALPQHAAGQLVGVAALLFLSLPPVTANTVAPGADTVALQTPPAPPASTATKTAAATTGTSATLDGAGGLEGLDGRDGAAQKAATSTGPGVAPVPHANAASGTMSAESFAVRHQQTEAYTVKRGDSLWKIAKERLGDGTRYVELAALNRDILHGEADFLLPGTVLRLPAHEPDPASAPTPGDSTYVVDPGDTLSQIAEDDLGDATAYPEIYHASRATEQPDGEHLTDPDLIRPGWRLTIPDQRTPPPAEHHHHPRNKVDGDHNGDDQGNRDNHADGPLEPAPSGHTTDASPELTSGPSPDLTPDPTPQPTPDPTPQPTPDPTPETAPETSRAPASPAPAPAPARSNAPRVAASDDERALPGWVLPGLGGAGAALAGSLLIALRQHRRTQLRYRRPGYVIAPPPPELRAAEKSATASGSLTAPRIETFDDVLRHLATATTPAPRLLHATLGDDTATVHLHEPATLPPPWAGQGTTWTIRLDHVRADCSATTAPYPLLVSIGTQHRHTDDNSDSDSNDSKDCKDSKDSEPDGDDIENGGTGVHSDDGGLVYVNLEELRTVALTGDPDRAAALARQIAAELALNPWSTLVEIDALGIGVELADIDPLRLHHHPDHNTDPEPEQNTGLLDQIAHDLATEDPTRDPDQYRALIVTAAASPAAATAKLAKVITSYAGRPGAAILTVSRDAAETDTELRLSPTGRLTTPKPGRAANHTAERDLDSDPESDLEPDQGLHLDVVAAGLTSDEARACATLVDLTREATNIAAPAAGEPGSPADATGALTAGHTVPRASEGPAGEASLLALDVGTYETSAAVVAEDVETLAPLAAAGTAAQVAEQDPDLDEDLARWQASTLLAPKLTLLGPVSARTLGDPRTMAHRRPYYVELLSFLVLHPAGVTAEDVADAFGIRPDRARKDLGVLRGWLGRDPRTGKPHLPNARQTHTDGVHAPYAVHGVTTDMDLFRRLRTRGQSRGAPGIDDLRTALSLVTGEPFTDLRPAGWGWLLDGERHDHLMSCAIVDTAHIVTTHALTNCDLDLARFSAETAYRAAPHDETSRLDVIAVAQSLGHDDEAERALTEGILNRSDDDLGPIEIPDRTEQIIRQHRWIADHRSDTAS